MEPWDEITDALQLSELAAARGTAEERTRAQAEMVLWALRATPVGRLRPVPPSLWEDAARAVERVARGGAPDPAPVEPFEAWFGAVSTDWATRQALDEVRGALARVLRPSDWGLEPGETELATTAREVVRAAGLWDWDELLAERYLELGMDETDYWAQVVVQDHAEEEAHRALCAILRRCLAPRPADGR